MVWNCAAIFLARGGAFLDLQQFDEAKECALKCVKVGWEPVFVRDGDTTSYKIVDKKKVMDFVGDRVEVSGKIDGDKVTVISIKKIPR